MVFALLLTVVPGAAWASAPEKKSEITPQLLIEPTLLAADVTRPIPGAQHTHLVAALREGERVRAVSREDFSRYQISWDDWYTQASEALDALLASIEPRFFRDSEGVIEYAILESEDPLTASLALAPGLERVFRDTIGEELILILPDRYHLYLFPRFETSYGRYSHLFFRQYRSATYPASKEVFLRSEGKLRAIAIIDLQTPPQ